MTKALAPDDFSWLDFFARLDGGIHPDLYEALCPDGKHDAAVAYMQAHGLDFLQWVGDFPVSRTRHP